MGQYSISWTDALHVMPASLANQIMACHWMSQGVELEPITKTETIPNLAETLEKLTNRPKSWDLEPM